MIVAWRLFAAACLFILIADGVQRSLPSGELRDFGSFVASARAGTEGRNPYSIHPLTFHVVLPGFDVWNPNLNPPVSVLLFRVFEAASPADAFRWWWTVSFVSYLLAVALLVHRNGGEHGWLPAMWALAAAGFWDTLALGQIYLPLVLTAVAAWLLLERGHATAAGVLIGFIVALKPNFAAWPAVLLLAGHVRAPLAAVACAAALSAVPLVTHGAAIYGQWADVILADESRTAFLTNASIPGFAARLGVPIVGMMAAAAILTTVAVWSFRGKPAPLDASALGIVAGIAASPIAWVHYTLFLLPVFFRWHGRAALLPAAMLLVAPVALVLRYLDAPLWQQVTIGSVYNWAVVVCLVVVGYRVRRPSAGCEARGAKLEVITPPASHPAPGTQVRQVRV